MDNIKAAHIRNLQAASINNKLVAFVGAGVSANSGVPMWGELTALLKADLPDIAQKETDDLKIAQLYYDAVGQTAFIDRVRTILKHNKVTPNPLHTAILELNPKHIITTNYDDLFEQEIFNQYRKFAVVRRNEDIPQMEYPNALIKMHGDFNLGNIVLTENDYYDYPRKFSLIRSFVQSLFASQVVLFIGFSFSDLNLKIILKELQSILSDKMRRVYLISMDEPDHLTAKYFENKGINILYFSDEEIKELMDGIPHIHKAHIEAVNNPLGEKLRKIITAIGYYIQPSKKDIVSAIYQRFLPYQNQIRVWGDSLKCFFPEEERPVWNPHSTGLQLYSKYFTQLHDKIKTFAGKKDFLVSHAEIDWTLLRKIAVDNNIFEIEGIRFVSDKFIKSNLAEKTDEMVELFHDFKLSELQDRLYSFETKDPAYTLYDLEHPYVLYLLGDYRGAYKIYNHLLPLFWRKQKYILYFICLYNMHSLRYALKHFGGTDGDKIYTQLEKLNVPNILNGLTLPYEIKDLFNNLISNQYVAFLATKSTELKEKIHSHRRHSENGGWSFNSDISALLTIYDRGASFFHLNLLIGIDSIYFKALSQNTIAGILNSYETLDNSTHIPSLNIGMVELCIFGVDLSTLIQCFKQYRGKSLTLDEDCSTHITQMIDRLSDEFAEFDTSLLRNVKIRNHIVNLLYVLSCCEVISIKEENLYTVIISLCKERYHIVSIQKFLTNLLVKYRPNVAQACELIKLVFENAAENIGSRSSIDRLAEIIKTSGEPYFINVDFKELDKSKAYDSTFLYDLLTEQQKNEFVEFCLPHTHSLIEFLPVVIENQLDITDHEKFKELLKEPYATTTEIGKYMVAEGLCNMSSNPKYHNVKCDVDAVIAKHPEMKFAENPIAWRSYEAIPFRWILGCQPDIRKQILAKPEVKPLIKQFILEENPDKEDIEALFEFL